MHSRTLLRLVWSVAALSCICCQASLASYVPGSKTLQDTVQAADVVVAARIVNYSPTPSNEIATLGASIAGAGNYTLEVVQTIKGHLTGQFTVHLPSLASLYYNNAPMVIRPGRTMLLCLTKNQGTWSPVDQTVPLIPIRPPVAATGAAMRNTTPVGRVIDLMLDSVGNTPMRQADAFFLRDTVDPRIVSGLARYADDSNEWARSGVLYCLATNQFLPAIPKIRSLEESLEAQHESSSVVLGLQSYRTAAAVPYLNLLVSSSSQYIRYNAAFMLRKYADRSSIPFLFLALNDDDAPTAYDCYVALHRLFPTLGKPWLLPDFGANKEYAVKPLYDWWEDELAGKHTVSGDPVAARARSEVSAEPRVLALYYGWFGTPERSQFWQHYGAVDTTAKTIESQAHYPIGGPYDSTDPAILERQVTLAKAAGIDTLVCSWWGKNDQTDKAFRALLPIAAAHDMAICPFFERNPRPGNADAVQEEWEYILTQYGKSPGFLRVGGKPVIFIYENAISELTPGQWAQMLLALDTEHAPGVAALADASDAISGKVFDGLFMLDPSRLDSVGGVGKFAANYANVYRDLLLSTHPARRLSILTVTPGHKDNGPDPSSTSGAEIDASERGSGSYYSQEWQAALGIQQSTPNTWILVNSFNQWQSGSEIEPSVQFNDEYLTLTQEYTTRLKIAGAAGHQ